MKENTPLLKHIQRSKNPEEQKECVSIRCRHVLAGLSALGFAVVYALRVNLSVALVAMVNQTFANEQRSSLDPECERNQTSSELEDNGVYNWDQQTQGIILGSFFYGYIITQLPGGWLAARFGGKHLLAFGVLCTAVLTLLTPLAADQGLYTLIGLRVLEGLGEGVTFPAMHAMWSKWAPPLERSKLCAVSYSGNFLGTIVAMPLSGLLAAHGFAGGWPSVFYVFGSTGIIWFILWEVVAYESPASHPRISMQERDYIETSLGAGQAKPIRTFSTPWKSIWRSSAVWAIIVAHFCQNWGFYTFLTCLPSYFKEVLNFDISENGLLSALPYAVMYFFTITSSQLADCLRYSGRSTTTDVRKIFNLGGFLIPACLMVATSYTGCDNTTLAVTLFSLALGFSGLTMSGYNVNHLDIAPRYAGLLMGITNTAGTLPGIFGPYVAGWITNNQPTRLQWQKVFYITAGFYLFGAVIFTLFASGEEQKWNQPCEGRLIQVSLDRENRKPLAVFGDNASTAAESDGGVVV